MARKSQEPSGPRETRLEKAQKAAQETEKAMAEYRATGRAADERRSRLKSLRLAKEAADLEAGPKPSPKPRKKR